MWKEDEKGGISPFRWSIYACYRQHFVAILQITDNFNQKNDHVKYKIVIHYVQKYSKTINYKLYVSA